MTTAITDLGKVIFVDMRAAEIGAVHQREFELILAHNETTRSIIGIDRETLLGWSGLLGGGMLKPTESGAQR